MFVQAYPTLRVVWVIVSHPDNKATTPRRYLAHRTVVNKKEHPLGAATFVYMSMHARLSIHARCSGSRVGKGTDQYELFVNLYQWEWWDKVTALAWTTKTTNNTSSS